MNQAQAIAASRGLLGPNLRRLRQSRGVGLRETARRTGMMASTLCRVEAGTLDVRGSTLLRILDALGADITDVWPTRAEVLTFQRNASHGK